MTVYWKCNALLALVFLTCLSSSRVGSGGYGVSWKNCNNDSAISVRNVTVSPDPPRTFRPFAVTSIWEFSSQVDTGEMKIEVFHQGEEVYYETMEFCRFCNDRDLPCPISPGVHTIHYQMTVRYPRGVYQGRITAYDETYQSLLCTNFQLTVLS